MPRIRAPIIRSWAWIAGQSRGVYAVAAAAMFLALAAASPWFQVASPWLSALTVNGALEITRSEAPAAAMLRVGAGAFAAAATVALVCGRGWVLALRRPAWLMLALVIAFPQLLLQWDGERLLSAQLVYSQVDRVATDMEVSLTNQQLAWRQLQHFVILDRFAYTDLERPGDVSVGLEALALHNQARFLRNELGFTNEFFNTAGRGFFVSILGYVTFLFGAYRFDGSAHRLLPRDVGFVGVMVVCLFAALLLPRWVGADKVERANVAVHQGSTGEALQLYQAAMSWKPVFRYSLAYTATMGELIHKLGCATCKEALVFQAMKHITEGRYDAGAAALFEVRRRYPEDPAVAFWLSAALTEAGRDAFNRGQYSAAEATWRAALAINPLDAMAWHGLSIARIRVRDFDRATLYAEQVVKVQDGLVFRRLTPRAQWYVAQAWAAYDRADYVGAFRAYALSLMPNAW